MADEETAETGLVWLSDFLGLKFDESAHWKHKVTIIGHEIRKLKTKLCEIAPWSCPCCGDHIKMDEDGCCVHCGEDALNRVKNLP